MYLNFHFLLIFFYIGLAASVLFHWSETILNTCYIKEVTKLSDLFLFRQYHLNNSTTSATTDVHMDMYCGLPVDFSSFNLPRNGDFTQVSDLSFAEIINRIFFNCQGPQSVTGD